MPPIPKLQHKASSPNHQMQKTSLSNAKLRYQVMTYPMAGYSLGKPPLRYQVELCKNKVVHTGKDEKRDIAVCLNSGGQDHKTEVVFQRLKKTLHIWFPVAVLQDEVGKRIRVSKLIGI